MALFGTSRSQRDDFYQKQCEEYERHTEVQRQQEEEYWREFAVSKQRREELHAESKALIEAQRAHHEQQHARTMQLLEQSQELMNQQADNTARFSALLEKWEQQAARMDAILSTRETSVK